MILVLAPINSHGTVERRPDASRRTETLPLKLPKSNHFENLDEADFQRRVENKNDFRRIDNECEKRGNQGRQSDNSQELQLTECSNKDEGERSRCRKEAEKEGEHQETQTCNPVDAECVFEPAMLCSTFFFTELGHSY